jgi:hypothetical protein
MKTVRKIAVQSFLPTILLMTAIVTSALSTRGVETAFSQTTSNQTLEEINQTAAELNQTAPELMNQTAAELNQTAAQTGSETTTNQTQAIGPKLTISDVQNIRDSLEEVKKSIADGKAIDALKTINEIDDKLLVAMSENPPQMLEKSTGNNDDN